MIRLSNVSKYYSKNQTVSLGLRKINLELGLNEFVAIVGESGSGKTTLLNVLSGIDSYEEGEMYINNDETSYFSKADWENYRKKYIAFIFQNYHLIESYTVLQNVEAALILSGYPKEEIRDRALEIIDRVGLIDHIKHKATKLSGGQKQRVVIARAIAKDAPVIVADEPTGNLDSESAQNIIELLAEIAKDKLVIVVTHDFKQVENQATRRIRIFDGEIVEDKKIKKVSPNNLPSLEDKDYKMNFKETIKMVFRNLWATPKKSILLLVIFLFSTFFFAFIYAGFLYSQAEQTSYNNELSYIPDTRIILNKEDGSAFTEAELTSLENNRRVASVVPFDFMFEVRQYIQMRIGDWYDDFYLPSPMIFPISMFPDVDEDLEENEIVVSFQEYYFEDEPYDITGETLNLMFNDENIAYHIAKFYPAEDHQDMFPNVGRPIIIVHENTWNQLGKVLGFSSYTQISLSYINNNGQEVFYSLPRGERIILNDTLPNNQINVPDYLLNYMGMGEADVDITIDAFYETLELNDMTIDSGDPDLYGIEVNQAIYDALFNADEIYQVSIFAEDSIDAINLSESLESSGDYQVYHPASERSSNQLEGLIFLVMNIGFIFMFGGLFLVIFFVAYVIIKNIINSKLNDYAIFRTIGANKSTIRSFIYLETMFVAFFAYVVFLAFVIIINPYINENGPLYVLKFYTFKNFVYLLIFVLVFSLLLSRRYLSRVYHDTVAETLRREME